MSIEQALAENTAAIRELIETIKAGVPATAAQVEAVVVEAKKDNYYAPDDPVEKAEPKTEAPAAEEKAKPATEAPAEDINYDHVKDAIVGLHKAKGRAAAIAVLEQFGVDVATKLTLDQYPAVVRAAKAALEG